MSETARLNANAADRRAAREGSGSMADLVAEAEEARLDAAADTPDREPAPVMGDLVVEAEEARLEQAAAEPDRRSASTSSGEVDISRFHDGGGYYTIDGEQVRGKSRAEALAREKGLI